MWGGGLGAPHVPSADDPLRATLGELGRDIDWEPLFGGRADDAYETRPVEVSPFKFLPSSTLPPV